MRAPLATLPALLAAAALALGGAACRAGAAGRGRDAAGDPAAEGAQPAGPEEGAPPEGLPGASPSDGPVASAPVVVGPGLPKDAPDARVRRPVEEADTAFAEKLATAREALAAGEEALALEILGAALALDPPDPWAGRFRGLRSEIRSRRVETTVLRADARAVRDYLPFGSEAEFVVRLRNVGTSPVVIHPPTGDGPDAVSGTTLFLVLRRLDCDIYAAEYERSWTQAVSLLAPGDAPIVVPPEGVHSVPFRVPADEAGTPLSGLRSVTVSGEVRASRIEAGTAEPFGRVPIRPGRVVVLPRNYEPLAADPVGSLRKAVAADAPVHLLVACEFVAPADRAAAVGVLAGALATGPRELRTAVVNGVLLLRRASAGQPLRPLARPLVEALEAHPERTADLVEALRTLAGVSLPPDARLWVDWWRRELAGPGSLVPSDEGIASPAGPGAEFTPR